MAIYRGIGGAGDSTTDATVTVVTEKAVEAAASAASASTSETNASNSASAASTSATNASNSASNASTSETNASNSATAAATSASNASSSETNAASSASAASTSETNAAASESAASTSETNAATSETNAATSETNAASSATAASNSASAAATSETNASSSASAASTSASNASTSETNAATSETNAGNSATAAASSASSASTSASTATTKASEASTSATNAATSETNAATSETNAATSASAASTSESNAATSASTATTQASNAATSATNAATSATNAATSETNAQTAADTALSALDNFDDRYLGQKTSDPTLDNDGNALVAGALYFNTTDDVMKVYDGSVWVAAYASLSGTLVAVNNLSDLTSVSSARTNLGLGTAATTASTDYATAAQGTLADSAVQPADNVSTLTNDASYLTGNQTITLSGDASGSGTTAITVTVADDSHNHIIANVDGLQTALDAKGTLSNVVEDTTPQLGGDLASNGNDINFGDNDKAIFGNSSDLQIYHSGGASIIRDSGTGSLYIDGSSEIFLRGQSGFTNMVKAIDGAEVQLYHNNAPKLFTTATGVDVTGTVTADGLTVDTDTLYVDATNNRVGIGTASPSSKAHIYGSGQTTANITDAGNQGAFLRVSDSGFSAGNGGGVIFASNQSDDTGAVGMAAIKGLLTNGSNNTTGNLAFSTRNATTDTNLTERMRINSSGNVGIGTTSPAKTLDIDGQFRVRNGGATGYALLEYGASSTGTNNWHVGSEGDGSFRFYNGNFGSGTERMRIASNGNVGIGTSNPVSSLQVNGGIRARGGAPGAFGVNNNGYAFEGNGGDIDGGMFSSADGTIDFYTDSARRVTITSAGLLQFNSGYGSVATAYGCRAWVNFNGTGTVAIRASGNVSSITDNGTGIYTVNFTTAMPDTNYAVVGGSYQITSHPNTSFAVSSAVPMATTSVRVNFGTTGGSDSVGFTNDSAATVASIAILR